MTTTEQEFLRIFRAAVLGEPLPDGFSVGEAGALFALARRHDLGHLLGGVLSRHGDASDEKIRAALERERLRAVWRAGVLSHEEERITALLDREGIPYIPLKGAVVRPLWPEPWMRTSCDLDLLVHREDAAAAATLICENLGYTAKGETYHNHSLYSEGEAVHLELHFSLTEGGTADPALSRVWDYAAPLRGARWVLSPAFLLFHLVSHLATHFLNGGGGARAIADLYLVRAMLEIDGEEFAALAREAGLLTFARAVFALSEVWFSDGTPTAETDLLGERLLRGCLYGDTDRRAAVERAKATAPAARREARRARRAYLRARLFPAREQLLVLYPRLARHGWLLPLCTLHRWGRLLLGGRLRLTLKRRRAAARVTDEAAARERELLSVLGLLP